MSPAMAVETTRSLPASGYKGAFADAGLVLLRRFVVKALQNKIKGNASHYENVVAQVDNMRDDPRIMRVFSQCVSQFDERAHGELLTQILGVSLWTCKEEVQDAILTFVVNLASANSACLSLCLDMLVRNFLPPAASPSVQASDQTWGEQMLNKQTVLDKVHGTLAGLVELVPTATTRLQPILLQRMPYKGLKLRVLKLYMESLFKLAESKTGEVLRETLLLAIVDQLLSIDVEVKLKDYLELGEEFEGAAEEAEARMEDGMFDMDIQEGHRGETGNEPASTTGQEAAEPPRKVKETCEMAVKLDDLMTMTFGHLVRRIDKKELQLVFETLMRSFQLAIMQTYRSKFVQFLLFFICSKSTACTSHFIDYLLSSFTSTTNAPTRRLAAAAYLASFLARAKFVTSHDVMSALSRLASWLSAYAAQESKPRQRHSFGSYVRREETPDTVIHSVFYAGTQAFFYILMYHMGSLSKQAAGLQLLQGLPLRELVDCRLNPFNACRSAIVEEFATQAEALQLVSCWPVIHANRKLNEKSVSFGGENHLDMFFPFDPYLLERSRSFLATIWVSWDEVEKPYEDYSDEEHEDVEESSSEDEKSNEPRMVCSDYGSSLGRSFEPMSYTPPRGLAPMPAALPAVLPMLKK